jgi:hypothetical protein
MKQHHQHARTLFNLVLKAIAHYQHALVGVSTKKISFGWKRFSAVVASRVICIVALTDDAKTLAAQ